MRKDLLLGTLDLLILKALSTGEMHGWDISKRILIVSKDRLNLKQGSLYPALHRMEHRGWIKAKWGISEAGRSAKFYHLTRKGEKQLEEEREHWLGFANAMGLVLRME